jgi:hypothetical protein
MTYSEEEMGIIYSYLLENADIEFPVLPWVEECQSG